MPYRLTPLISNNVYHIYNRSIEKKLIFTDTQTNSIFLQLCTYYRSNAVNIRFSLYRKMPAEKKELYDLLITNANTFTTEVLAYCLMPTHYHLLLYQSKDYGISAYMSNLQNAFTRYYNIRCKRTGHIFEREFQSVLIRNDEQLKHVSRYIHLNPYTSHIVNKDEVLTYPWSSMLNYLSSNNSFINTKRVLSCFGLHVNRYKEFVLMNADYQEMLEHCKHTYRWR